MWAFGILGILVLVSIGIINVMWEMFDNEEGIDD
ncbi:MAG: cytochrome bd-I oxidase subunit CydX [Actinobacteria bacterium]|nr:cytochrome bd-I oxidase subunit CydX [Actinomycetota bacterium]